ncbi:TPA: xylulose 5-phosphate 3-epimerase, partial [Escherichia coli]|nr:xylulose 5-phosphate 3-epimerase [Escherichia coli]HCD6271537.1 xylulose 5-phosphate 3-epimerase [Escherichia coli]HCX5578892.1 xylulose 5-phosphate 3-epimerase [Escherichia coli]
KILRNLNYRGTFLIEMWTEKATEPLLEIIHARQWIEEKMRLAGWDNI